MTALLVTGTFAPKPVRYSTCDHTDTPHVQTKRCENPVHHSNRYPDMEEEDQ